jgi:hypothetical protein
MLTEEKLNANYLKFINYLQKYNCYSEDMMKELGEKIKLAPYSMERDMGGAYDGAMIDVTLNTLCKIGAQINNNAMGANGGDKIAHPLLAVNNNMLMRVLHLINIAKAEMFTPNKSEWHKKNLGRMYEFVENKTKLKLGARSLYLCQKYGIQLEEEEFEAFLTIDNPDDTGERFQSPLYTMVKATKMFTLVELRQKQLASNKTETQEM